jgi:serine phosphatase RsbU (regulator of sigma subunit)
VFLTGNEITLPAGFSLPPGDALVGVFYSGFVTPVLFKDARRGILLIGKTTPGSFFDAGKLKIARMVAEYLGIVLMMSELQKRRSSEDRALRDLEIASQIQLSLMPGEFSAFQGLDIAGTCRPAMQAGGDYFDVLALPDGSALCVIADVMGKGLPAALLATMLRTNLRAVVATGEADPGKILHMINNLMCPDLIKLEMFITMGCVWISPQRDCLRHACAGHLLPLLQKADDANDIREVPGGGMPIGIFADGRYVPESAQLKPGDRVLLYTDGLIEASDPANSLFEVSRVRDSLACTFARGSQASLNALLGAVEEFTTGAAPSDDRTALLISRTR